MIQLSVGSLFDKKGGKAQKAYSKFAKTMTSIITGEQPDDQRKNLQAFAGAFARLKR